MVTKIFEVVELSELNRVRRMVLDGSFNTNNTRFINFTDRKTSIAASPAQQKRYGKREYKRVILDRHFDGKPKYGYVYASFKGWIMATTAYGNEGWSEIVKLTDTKYVSLNGWHHDDNGYLRAVTMEVQGDELLIYEDKHRPKEVVGLRVTKLGVFKVVVHHFKGWKKFVSRIDDDQEIDKWITFFPTKGRVMYSPDLKYVMDAGKEIRHNTLTNREIWSLHLGNLPKVERKVYAIHGIKGSGVYNIHIDFMNYRYYAHSGFVNARCNDDRIVRLGLLDGMGEELRSLEELAKLIGRQYHSIEMSGQQRQVYAIHDGHIPVCSVKFFNYLLSKGVMVGHTYSSQYKGRWYRLCRKGMRIDVPVEVTMDNIRSFVERQEAVSGKIIVDGEHTTKYHLYADLYRSMFLMYEQDEWSYNAIDYKTFIAHGGTPYLYVYCSNIYRTIKDRYTSFAVLDRVEYTENRLAIRVLVNGIGKMWIYDIIRDQLYTYDSE